MVALTNDCGVMEGLIAALSLQILNLSYDAFAVDDLAIDYMLLVQMRCGHGGNEELRAIGAYSVSNSCRVAQGLLTRSSVRHAQQERPVVDLLKVLVLELLAVNALTARAIAFCEVSTLDHEALNHAMEARAFVVQWLASLADTFLAGA